MTSGLSEVGEEKAEKKTRMMMACLQLLRYCSLWCQTIPLIYVSRYLQMRSGWSLVSWYPQADWRYRLQRTMRQKTMLDCRGSVLDDCCCLIGFPQLVYHARFARCRAHWLDGISCWCIPIKQHLMSVNVIHSGRK